jgi:hypothetical protein
MRRLLPLTALLALVLPTSADAAVTAVQIQPGASISTPIGGCTLNFVYTDQADRTYVGTAGHCADVGHRIRSGNGTEFGTVVFSENAYPVNDFALIEIDDEDLGLVSPAMRYWGGPTGLYHYGEAERNDTVLAYGYGIGYGTTEYTRRRIGAFQTETGQRYTAALNCIFGDSGGPVVHGPTGKALGVIDVLALPGTGGVLIENALRRIKSLTGLNLTLSTAPLEPIPQI